MTPKIQHINPDTLMKNPAFSQIVITQGSGKTVYIGGQNSVSPQGEILGKENLKTQAKQAMENLQTALHACCASFENVVKLNIHIVQGQNIYDAFQVSQPFLANAPNPPAITVLVVAGLANPNFLIEIDAIAFIPD
jgi:enamine deaminase RidA (YjgF/YER057c/UK114 family)